MIHLVLLLKIHPSITTSLQTTAQITVRMDGSIPIWSGDKPRLSETRLENVHKQPQQISPNYQNHF